jgi:hypothetical protein
MSTPLIFMGSPTCLTLMKEPPRFETADWPRP